RALVSSPLAEWMHQLHPVRLPYEVFSDANPMMAPVANMAEEVRENRRPVAADNPFIDLQETVSPQIVAGLNAWRDMTEALAERTFLAVYGSPVLQAAVGIDPAGTRPLRQASKNPLHHELLQKRIAELKSRIPVGGLREAGIRALIYVGLARGTVDERGFEALRRIRRMHGDMSLREFKSLAREQFLMLMVDTEAALAALPPMLPADADTRRKLFDLIKQVLSARGDLSAEQTERLQRIARAFGLDEASPAVQNLRVAPPERASCRSGSAETHEAVMLKDRETGSIAALGPIGDPPASKCERLIARAKQVPAARTVVVHPCEETAL